MLHRKIIRFRAGVYKIENLLNKNTYIGATKNLYNRYHTHKCKLKKGIHSCTNLNVDYLERGGDNFIFTVLYYCDEKDLTALETFACNEINPYYNKRCLDVNTNVGLEIVESRRAAISNTLKRKNKELRDSGLPTLNPMNHDKWIAVDVFDMLGNKINSFDSFSDVARELFGKRTYISNISRICKASKGSLLGYRFRYKSDNITQLTEYNRDTR